MDRTGADVVGGSFDRSPEPQAQAAELAVERAKRRVEQGGHAVLVVDSLDALPAGARRRVFGAGRSLEEGGSLTVIAVTGEDSDALRLATTRIVLEPGGPDSRAPKVDSARSGTLRSDRLLDDQRLRHRRGVDEADQPVGALHLRRDGVRATGRAPVDR